MEQVLDPNSTNSSNKYDGLVAHAAKNGVIMAAVSIAITVLLYVVDFTLLADWKIGILFMILSIGYVIYAGLQYRKEIGGFLPYGKAFQHALIFFGVSGLIALTFNGILYSFIDPDLSKNLVRITLERTEEMFKGFGMKDYQIEEKIAEMEVDLPKQFSLLGQLKAYLWSWIFYLIVGALTSLATKKNPPETF
ncbi:DUF4199 domain-containing protein [Pseudochryseolinea flava]|uniref:DUF4199 domain-containing protein n=1 Tax=Pseudochryseolinea flava TaxID=2059302 RepID=A0A364Y265_9BACT|nr:DUF4199 domain-containing protein [Pseudochryseolinea flava]RAV99865.1 hypothetical protein DQQ10_17650 [Pseudochryseolinea flava]